VLLRSGREHPLDKSILVVVEHVCILYHKHIMVFPAGQLSRIVVEKGNKTKTECNATQKAKQLP